ncbi:MAG: hypothetical protein COB60_05575 [Flavobacteriaceae bacterium]|nr:MAG: hypothetical protein COB60_05575 [Flavobacteriaceae bacterium]
MSLTSCETESIAVDKRLEELVMEAQVVEIQEMSKNMDCDTALEWGYAAFGEKACGGPRGYVAYPIHKSSKDFLVLLIEHTDTERAFIKKWDVMSDCLMVQKPSSVRCVEGQATLIYE